MKRRVEIERAELRDFIARIRATPPPAGRARAKDWSEYANGAHKGYEIAPPDGSGHSLPTKPGQRT